MKKPKCKNQKYGHIYNKHGICINCKVKDETRTKTSIKKD